MFTPATAILKLRLSLTNAISNLTFSKTFPVTGKVFLYVELNSKHNKCANLICIYCAFIYAVGAKYKKVLQT